MNTQGEKNKMADYDPHLQGSDTLPAPGCDAPIARDTARDVETAREANRLHDEANKLADRSGK
jgi:hypothetical protein